MGKFSKSAMVGAAVILLVVGVGLSAGYMPKTLEIGAPAPDLICQVWTGEITHLRILKIPTFSF